MNSNTDIKASSLNTILIGVAVGVLCCVLSLVMGYILLRPHPKGLIGAPCDNGVCHAPNAVCKFNMCYEKCKGRNAWPCESDDNVPYMQTYWCDYSGCPAWQPPQDITSEESKKPASLFDQAVKQQMDSDAQIAKQKIAQQEAKVEKEKQEQAAAAQAADDQKTACTCTKLNDWVPCGVGKRGNDGNAEQPWCYVQGGKECEKALLSSNDNTKGSTWRLCKKTVDY